MIIVWYQVELRVIQLHYTISILFRSQINTNRGFNFKTSFHHTDHIYFREIVVCTTLHSTLVGITKSSMHDLTLACVGKCVYTKRPLVAASMYNNTIKSVNAYRHTSSEFFHKCTQRRFKVNIAFSITRLNR